MPLFLAPIICFLKPKMLWLIGALLAVLAIVLSILRLQSKAEQAGAAKERVKQAERSVEVEKIRKANDADIRRADDASVNERLSKWTRS